jgi:hypothetical protein
MRKIISIALLLTFVVALSVPVSAQDDAMIVCDSTLLTLVLLAEYDHGFHSMYDLSTFEKGQLAPLFDSMMAMMEDEMMEEGDMMEEEMMEEGDMMMDDMMMLTPGNVADEPTACTDLRAEVESFLYDKLSADLMMSEESM